ncbi:hypothetical protein BC940DRAFT_323169 [Gongronella butleri]|nr:hypothetical protein BC940DRAFT_323169 [Gongronella butleri]
MPPNTSSVLPTVELADEVFTWEEVCHYVQSNQIKRIHRHPSVQVVYQQWLTETLRTYGTIEDYLLATKLAPFKTAVADDDDAFSASAGSPPVILLPNDFPYSVERGIDHQLLWSKRLLSESFVEHFLRDHYDAFKVEWVYFVNPPEVQSVKKLPHVHIFLRNRQNAA